MPRDPLISLFLGPSPSPNISRAGETLGAIARAKAKLPHPAKEPELGKPTGQKVRCFGLLAGARAREWNPQGDLEFDPGIKEAMAPMGSFFSGAFPLLLLRTSKLLVIDSLKPTGGKRQQIQQMGVSFCLFLPPPPKRLLEPLWVKRIQKTA